MSKQKLYLLTEEQLIHIVAEAATNGDFNKNSLPSPLHIPDDEEIMNKYPGNYYAKKNSIDLYKQEGAKWLRDEILKQVK